MSNQKILELGDGIKRGVVYYNTGTGCAVRLLLSLESLRRHYAGPITILSEGAESAEICKTIGEATGAKVMDWDCGIPEGIHRTYLVKTRLAVGTPYETTVALDADTLIVGPIDELFSIAEESSFCVAQIGRAQSAGRVFTKRIRQWAEWLPEDIEPAINFGPAINVGVLAFKKNAEIFKHWLKLALPGRHTFVPEEGCCQVILHRYPHRILDGIWNCSCKLDDPLRAGVRIIHYHGKKHCRPGLPYHGDIWVKAFEEARKRNLACIREWLPAGDRALLRHLKREKHERKIRRSQRLQIPVSEGQSNGIGVKIYLGTAGGAGEGWTCAGNGTFKVDRRSHWKAMMGSTRADRLFAVGLWDRLSTESLAAANSLAYRFLQRGGCLRISVKDGLSPANRYKEEFGQIPEPRSLRLDHASLAAMLEAEGFEVEKLEYWDESGTFHYRPWSLEDGVVKVSAFLDRRNRRGKLLKTSLIIDAWKR